MGSALPASQCAWNLSSLQIVLPEALPDVFTGALSLGEVAENPPTGRSCLLASLLTPDQPRPAATLPGGTAAIAGRS